MSAGLPGLGLGGLFFVLLALLAPFVELIRTTRGRSSVAAWRAVGRQFALALMIVAAVELTLRLLYALADATARALPEVGPGQTPGRPLTPGRPQTPDSRPAGGLVKCVRLRSR